MGIRFLCPNCGHKLNVKSFLAGKRGVCPQCTSGLDIPLESQITKETGKSGEDAQEVISMTPPPPAAGLLPARDRKSAPDDSDKDAPWLSIPKPEAPAVNPTPLPSFLAPSSKSPTAPARPASDTPPTVPMQAPGANLPAVPMGRGLAPTPAIGRPDPVDEAPDAVWYVRPPSGGQYGPARGEVMRKWMTEGRVSRDSLIWREGWNDWQLAGQVFPTSGLVAPPPPPPNASNTAYAPSSPLPITSRALHQRRQRTSQTLALITVSVLLVLGLILVAVLYYVWRSH